MLDRSRQWGRSVSQISKDHVLRYELALRYSTGRILDAACGCGYGSSLLAQTGVVTGVDYSPDAIDWAEEHFAGPTYLLGRIEDSPWEGRFETVVSLETIEHLPDPSKALKAFREACIGRFIASVPNEEWYPFKPEVFAKDDSPHFRHYTPEQFDELLTGHGFKVLERFCQESKQAPEVHSGTDGRFMVYVCA